MAFNEKDAKRLSVTLLVIGLLLLTFFLLKPVLLAIIGGLILGYSLMPLFSKINKVIKNRTIASLSVIIIVIIVVIVPLWFMVPLIAQQMFDIFRISQTIDMHTFLKTIFPSSNEQFIAQMTVTLNSAIAKISSVVINYLTELLVNIPKVLLDLFIVICMAFFGLRDAEKLKEFTKSLSPLNQEKEKIVVKHFKDMTDSIIYGQIIVGLVQGGLAGLGFILFGVENALVLTLLAIFLSIIPFIGPAFVWIPVAIYLFAQGNMPISIGYLAYNIFIVSVVDNIIRSYLVSRKTNISTGIVLIGMLGGIFVFGILGLIIGPLILAYLITLLEAFKDKSIYSLFSE